MQVEVPLLYYFYDALPGCLDKALVIDNPCKTDEPYHSYPACNLSRSAYKQLWPRESLKRDFEQTPPPVNIAITTQRAICIA